MSNQVQKGSINPRKLGGVYLSPEELDRNRKMFLEHDRIFKKLPIVPYLGEWDWRKASATPSLRVDLTNHIKNQIICNRPAGVSVGGVASCNSSNCGNGNIQNNSDVYPCSCFATIAAIESSSVVQQGKANWIHDNVPDLSDYFLYFQGGIDAFINADPNDPTYQSGVMQKVFDLSSTRGALRETNVENGGWWCANVKLNSFDPYSNPAHPPIKPIEFMGTSSIHMAKYFLRSFGPLVVVGLTYWSLFDYGNNDQYLFDEGNRDYLYSHHKFSYGGYPGDYDDDRSRESMNPMDMGHAMTVVGFKDIDPIVGQYFDSSPNNNPVTVTGYWKVRNSWGNDWADNGYCYLPYGTVTRNGITEPYSECDIGSAFPFYYCFFTPFQMHRTLIPLLIKAKNSKITEIDDDEMILEHYLNNLWSGNIPKPLPSIGKGIVAMN